jgi:anti-sigma B factor antagonist
VSSENDSLRESTDAENEPVLPHDMQVELEQLDDEAIAVVRIKGTLNRFSCPRLKDKLVRAVEAGTKELVVDMSDVSSVDSSGLGVLILTLQRTRQVGGGLRLAGANEKLSTILTTMALDRLLQQDDTVQDSLRYFRGSAGQASR